LLKNEWTLGNEYKLHFKQKKTFMSFQRTIVHIKIEEINSLEKVNKARVVVSKVNTMEERPSRPPQHYKKFDHKLKGKSWNYNKQKNNSPISQIKNKKENCFVCGKASHYAAVYRQRTMHNNNGSTSKNKANVTEVDDIIAGSLHGHGCEMMGGRFCSYLAHLWK